MLQFEKAAGVKMIHIPFKGSSETRNAVNGNQIVVAAINVGEAMQFLKGGTPIRCLGPAAYAEELRTAEAIFRQMWRETPWVDK